jgi:HEAT repeat protein
MQALDRSVEDSSRDVRIAAVRALASQTFRPALQRVEGAIKGRQIRDADLTEKMALYEAYGALAGEAGIQFLDGVLNGKGLFGKKEDSEIRACAAMALGRIGSDRALSSLQKASGEKDVIVRNAINRAFRGSTT